MSDLYHQREVDEIHQQIGFVVGKAFLIIVGALFIIVPSLDPKAPLLPVCLAFGALCLFAAVLWIRTERPLITQREELETFLVEAAKQYGRAGSIARLVEEYRARGADELSLSRLRSAPRLLRERADDRISFGVIISGAGSLILLNSILLVSWKGPAQSHLLTYALLGAGLGLSHIVRGVRLHRYARLFTAAHPNSKSQSPVIILDQERDKAA